MGHVESGHVVWMRSAIVAVALGVTVAAVAAACWLPQLHRHVAHPNHPLTTSVGSEFVINTDHGHLVDNSMPPCTGTGMGIDRLLMSLTGLSIRETVLFPIVRPHSN